MKLLKVGSLLLTSIISMNSFAQSNVPQLNSDFKVTAEVDAGCYLEADDINFGSLVIPLMEQKTTANFSIHCSKGTNVLAEFAFGGNYGIGGVTVTPMPKLYEWRGNGHYFYNNNGKSDTVYKYYGIEGWHIFENYVRNDIYETKSSGIVKTGTGVPLICNDSYGCYVYNLKSGVPSEYTVPYGYQNGRLTGVASQDYVGYTVLVPNSTSQIWNKGVNTFNTTAKGEKETFSYQAKIVVSNSNGKFPTPDSYMDNASITITY